MKKYVAICATLVALAWVGVAAAATPQGKLTGSGADTANGYTFAITTPVIDGGTSYIGLENDKSGNCEGDTGTVASNGFPADILCAHYVASSGCCNAGSPKMRLAYQEFDDTSGYTIVRITDNGDSPDTFAYGFTLTLADAQAWVRVGRKGAGFGANPWLSLFGGGLSSRSNFIVTAQQ